MRLRNSERSSSQPPARRYAIFADGWFADDHAKTAHGLLRYGRDEVACVIDSTLVNADADTPRRVLDVMPGLVLDPGRNAPIVGSVEEALRYSPTSVLVGVAPPGGRLPEAWLESLREAAGAGLEIVSGLHQRLGTELSGADVWEVREPPADLPLFSGEAFEVSPKVALTVGTTAAVGKMTATLEIERSARAAGLTTAFAATGQTGIVISGWGICVDAVVADFIAGAAEQLVLEAARETSDGGPAPDLILVEGQGSLGHPAYSGVTLGLLHGSAPDCLVLCCDASGEEIMAGVPRPAPARAARLYEEVAALVRPAPVVAVSVNTGGLDEAAARDFVERVSSETGLPAADPFRGSAAPILEAVRAAPKTAARRRTPGSR